MISGEMAHSNALSDEVRLIGYGKDQILENFEKSIGLASEKRATISWRCLILEKTLEAMHDFATTKDKKTLEVAPAVFGVRIIHLCGSRK